MIEAEELFPAWLNWVHLILLFCSLIAFAVIAVSSLKSTKKYYITLGVVFVVGATTLSSYEWNIFRLPQTQSVETEDVKQNLELGLGGAKVVKHPDESRVEGICKSGYTSRGWVVKEEGEEVKLSIKFICSGNLIRFDPVHEDSE